MTRGHKHFIVTDLVHVSDKTVIMMVISRGLFGSRFSKVVNRFASIENKFILILLVRPRLKN